MAKKTAQNKTANQKRKDAKGQRITKDMLIGEAITAYPSLIPVLLREGIHCVGCGAAYAETIGQGLESHGKSEKEIETIVKQLNDAIPRMRGNATLKVTEPALEKLRGFLKKDEGLLIEVAPGGCAGFSYTFDVAKKKAEGDTAITIGTIKIYIGKNSVQHIKGSTIDYIDTIHGAGFRIINPNVKKTCGCGNSFS